MRAFLTAASASIRGLPLLRVRPRRRWEEFLKNPLLWPLRFAGADMERLLAGRERLYLDRLWNELSASPDRFSEAARRHDLPPVFTVPRDLCGTGWFDPACCGRSIVLK